jgi:mRNA interferase MazF
VCILTRDAAIPHLQRVTCAPITRTIRGIRSEVPLGDEEGLPQPCVVSCDSIMTIPQASLDPSPVGRVGELKRTELNRAVRYALDLGS